MYAAVWLFAFLLAADGTDHLRRAQSLAAAKDWKGAEREYLAGLALSPGVAEAHNNLGAIYFQREDYQRAAREFATAARLDPQNPDFAFNSGLTQFRLARPQEALPYLLKARDSALNGAQARFIAALCYFHERRWSDSLSELESARAAGKNEPEVLYLIVKAAKNAGEREKGMRVVAELARTYPESQFVHLLLGEAYDLEHSSHEAEREFANAIQAAPAQSELHFALGYLYWEHRDLSRAEEMFRAELKLNPASAASAYYLGNIALRMNEPADALAWFRQAEKSDPSLPDIQLGLGQAYVEIGDYTNARTCFEKAAALLPDRVEPHYWLGRTLMRIGDAERGRGELEKVKSLQALERERAAAAFAQAKQ